MKRIAYFCLLGVLLAMDVTPANAGTKEEIMRLQSDVLALQNQLRIMEKSFNDQTEGLRSLVAQLNDQIGKSNTALEKMSTTIENQAAGGRSSDSAVLQEIRNLSMKLDDTATRISALAQQVSDLKLQSKPISEVQGGASAPLSADSAYSEAYNDLIKGDFDLAVEGFTSYVKNFPASDKADDALYSIGEAYYNQNKLPQAVTVWTRVLNDYPNGDKVASALFKRGKAELAMGERDNAAEDLKSVIQKYPDSPEAGLARAELESMGVNLSKPKPAPPRRKPR